MTVGASPAGTAVVSAETSSGAASVADLEALRMRSRVNEAEALLDPAGLGGFTVLEWRVPGERGRSA